MRKVIARSGGRVSERCARRSLALLFAGLAFLAFSASPAAAENVHVLSGTIPGFTNNPLKAPRAIAVDNSNGPNAGAVYIADNQNGRIVEFSAAGAFLTSWGKEVNEGTGDPNICSNAGAPANICKPSFFSESGPYAMGNNFSMAVDSSAGPSSGDIYVASGALIQKFDPTGHLVASFGGTPFPGAIHLSGFSSPALAVGSTGVLYVLLENTVTKYSENGSQLETVTIPFNASTGGAGGDFTLGPSGSLLVEKNGNFGNPGAIEKLSPTGVDLGQISTGEQQNHGLAFDPVANELLAVYELYPLSAVRAFRFNGTGEVIQGGGGACALGPSGCAASEEFANEGELNSFNGGATNAAVDTASHTLYVADTYNNIVRTYKFINVPKGTTGGIENLTRTSVRFLGHVDPDAAGEVTTCQFEYGTTKQYELGSVPCMPGTTSTPTDVSAELPANTLTSQTLYHYRLVAGNANGNRPAADTTFETLNAVGGVTTEPAEDVARLSATFKGSFTGDGVDTMYYFEYGPTAEYGQKTTGVDYGTGSGHQAISAHVPGLYSYYFYHYRFVAHNQYGTTYGVDQTFHTEAPELPTVEKTFSSGVDQDSATLNAQINPGEGLTVYRFEFGTSEQFGLRTLVAGPIDPESTNHTAVAELNHLEPGITYRFRVIATNFAGTTVGATESFTTPSAPMVDSPSATATRTTASLSALVGAGLSLTTYHFEYGTTTAYGSRTPESAAIGPDSGVHVASASLTGLQPGTTYHFRIVATNVVGTMVGADQTFVTAPPEAVKPEEAKCKRGFVKKHGRCVRKATRHHHKHKRHQSGKHGNG